MGEVLLVWALVLPASEKLPARAVGQLGDYSFYHGPGLSHAALSPDGRRVASAARGNDFEWSSEKLRTEYERTVLLWDVVTGKRQRALKVPGMVHCLAFSPDCKQLVISTGHKVVLHDLDTGKAVRLLWSGKSPAYRVQFSPDGKKVFISLSRRAVVLEVATGKRLRNWDEKSVAGSLKARESVDEATMSPDGKYVVWLIVRRQEIRGGGKFILHFPGPTALVLTDARSGKIAYRRDFEEGQLSNFAFSHDGRLFYTKSGSAHETASGKKVGAISWPIPNRVAFAPHGRLVVVGSSYRRAVVLSLKTKKPVPGFPVGPTDWDANVLSSTQSFSADGKWLLLGSRSRLRLFDTATGKERLAPGHRSDVTPRFATDGKVLYTTCSEWDCRWNVPEGTRQYHQKKPDPHANRFSVVENADGLFVRESATGRQVCDLGKGGRNHRAIFSAKGDRLLLLRDPWGQDETGELFDLRSGHRSRKWKFTWADHLGNPVFSPDGKLLASMDPSGVVRLRDSRSSKTVRTLEPVPRLSKDIYSYAVLEFSPDGAFLAATGYATGKFTIPSVFLTHRTWVYDVRRGKQVSCFCPNPKKKYNSISSPRAVWSPDGRVLAFPEEQSGKVRLFEAATGKVRTTFDGHRHDVHALAFSPNGCYLASGGKDGVVFVWDVHGPATLAKGRKPTGRDLVSWWADLASDDANRAAFAIAKLAATPSVSVAFLKDRLQPATTPPSPRLARLCADLGSDSFRQRQAATRELTRLGEFAGPAMRSALEKTVDLEVKLRLKKLLTLSEAGLPRETLQALRALEALERVGTAEAIRCIAGLTKGAGQACLTLDAHAALRRRKPRPR